MVIFMAYYELWNVMWNWKNDFTVKEFSSVFASPDPNKVLHDMTKKGLLDRIGWGHYKVNSPKELLSKRINVSESYDLVKKAGMKYALTGQDAVFFWTKGGYYVDRFFGFYPIHLKIKDVDLDRWKNFFRSNRRKFHIEGQPVRETLFGLFFVLSPKTDFNMEYVGDFQVDTLKDTLDFCWNRIYAYEPALEMLDEMYDLGLNIEYRGARTNF